MVLGPPTVNNISWKLLKLSITLTYWSDHATVACDISIVYVPGIGITFDVEPLIVQDGVLGKDPNVTVADAPPIDNAEISTS